MGLFTNKSEYGETTPRLGRIASAAALVLIVFIAFFSLFTKVPVGEIVIAVDMYDNEDSQIKVLTTGRKFYKPWRTDIIRYPIYVQNHTVENIAFKDTDGLSLDIDITVDYFFKPDRIPDIYKTYRQDAETIKNSYFDKWTRDAVVREMSGKYNAEDLYSKSISDFKGGVLEELKTRFENEGIEVRDIYLSDLRIPQSVSKRIEQKTAATQIAQTKERELQATEADVQKTLAEERGRTESKLIAEEGKAKARAIESESRAKANATLESSLTPGVLEFKKLENEKEAIQKWNGQLPKVSGDSGGLILDLGEL